MLKLLIFDLDDTLYDEKEYVHSGFKAVADFLQMPEVEEILIKSFKDHGRGKNFDYLLKKIPGIKVSKEELIKIYHKHRPEIVLPKETEQILQELSWRYPLCLITNGWPIVQKRKVTALGIKKYFKKIYYSQKDGMKFRKPHPKYFKKALQYFKVQPEETLMIGNDIVADIEGAKALGIKTFHIKKLRDIKNLLVLRKNNFQM